MPEGFDLGVSGLASNFDWRSLVDRLAQVERAPQTRLRNEQSLLSLRQAAYGSLTTQLSVLHHRVQDLKKADLYDARAATSSDEDFAKALVEAGASLGTYAFYIIQRATASVRQGAADMARALSATTDVSTVSLDAAPVAVPFKDGTFTINGQQISVQATATTSDPADTLQEVFTRIHTATGGDVTASYVPATDKVTLTSASNAEILLGSAADTSNFLEVLRLSNSGTSSISSTSSLGTVRFTAALASANFATTISDGGSGSGKFKLNGVEIAFNASTDTLGDVLRRINESNAGVTASYDTVNDRISLTNKATGDLGLALEDVTGNFLAATGLTAGSFQRGRDLLYTVNGGGQLSSHSNSIGEDSSGLSGLTVNVIQAGDVTVEVTSDRAKIKQAITDFLDEYNKAQALIDTNIASSTDAQGHVTAGTLAGESDAYGIASELRRQVNATFAFMSGTLNRLEDMGLTSNGDNDNLTLSDSAKLDEVLSANLSEVKHLFTHTSADETALTGLAVSLDAYLERLVGDDGTLIGKQDTLGTQSRDIDEQLTQQERQVQANRDRLITGFLAMEQAQARINQQLQFLTQRFASQ